MTDLNKKAFRAAFDLLEKLGLPDDVTDKNAYFSKAAGECSLCFDQYRDNLLARELILGVYSYLEKSARVREPGVCADPWREDGKNKSDE